MGNHYTIFYIVLFLGGVAISSISQILLKKASQEEHKSVIGEYINTKVIIAYILFLLSTVMNVIAYRGISIGLGTVLESTGYIYITLSGVLIFHEPIERKKIYGLCFILVGLIVYAMC